MTNALIRFGVFTLDPRRHSLSGPTGELAIRPKTFDVLRHLLSKPGQVIPRDELFAAVWPNVTVTDESLTRCISEIRQALGDDGQVIIKTVPKRGYLLDGPIETVPAEAYSRQLAPPGPQETPSAVSVRRPAVSADDQNLPIAGPGNMSGQWRVGRTSPLAIIDTVLAKAVAGERQVIFVTGEAGIGKSTFIDMALEQISDPGIGILRGGCVQRFGTDEAFLPLLDALTGLTDGTDVGSMVTAMRQHAPTWLLQLPGLVDRTVRAEVAREVFGASRERMVREFCALLEVLASERPRVIVLEDLHWSDPATLDVLSRFARGQGRAPVVVLASYRPYDTVFDRHPVRHLHQDLKMRGFCTELHLEPLNLDEVQRLLAMRFHDEALAAELAGPMLRRTQGHPLFVTSLADYLVEQKALVRIDERWHLASTEAMAQDVVPGDVLDMITHQIERLSEDEQQVLEVASAAGDPCSAALIAAGLGSEEIQVEDLVQRLVRKDGTLIGDGNLEWPDGTYTSAFCFRHVLHRTVLYGRLSPGRRVQIHARLADRLRKAYGTGAAAIASTLAQHFEQGRRFPEAIQSLVMAADNASKRLGHAQAVAYLTRALEIVERLPAEEQSETRIGLLRKRSWAARSAGDVDGSVRDLFELERSANARGNLRQEINALVAISRFGIYADRKLCLQAAQKALEKSRALQDDAFKVLVQGSSASINLHLKGWSADDAALCEKAMRLTADARDHSVLVPRLGIEGIVECWRSRYHTCRVSATRGKQLSQEVGDVYVYVLFNIMEATALLHLGQWRQLQKSTSEALAMAEKNANRPGTVLCRLTFAWLFAEAMDFDAARRECESIDPELVNHTPFAFFFQRAVLCKAYVGLRQPERVLEHIEAIDRRLQYDGVDLDFTISTQYHFCLAEYHLLLGEFDRARACAEALRAYTEPAPDINHLALAHSLLGRIAQKVGDWQLAMTHTTQALATLADADLPLAAWRVYAAAAEIARARGDSLAADMYSSRHAAVITQLAENFESSDRRRQTLMSALLPSHEKS